jgi:hypothetical protein
VWLPYIGLSVLPLSLLVGFNPVRFSWGYYHGLEAMPPPVQQKAETIDSYVWPVRDCFVIVSVIFLMNRANLRAALLGIHVGDWETNASIGVLASSLLFAIRRLLWKFFPAVKERLRNSEEFRGSAHRWWLEYLVSSFSQELWIAFCIVSMRQMHHSVVTSVVVTSAVFGAVHFPYRLGAFGPASLAVISGSLFIWRRSLLPSYLFHFLGNLGVLYRIRRGAASS